jgi:L-arabinose isomerase
MKNLNNPEIWYVTGSQHLYGEETLKQVAEDSQKIVEALNRSERVPPEGSIQAGAHHAGRNPSALPGS